MKKVLLIAFLMLSVNAIQAQKTDNCPLKKGYHGFVDLGYTPHIISYYDMSKIEIMTSHGYQFNPYVFVGAGVGMHFTSKYSLYAGTIPFETRDSKTDIPLYANFRANFTKTKVSPFVDAKLGYYVNNGGGLYANASLGCRFTIGNNMGIYAAIGYEYQELQVDHHNIHFNNAWSMSYTDFITKRSGDLQGLSLKVGFDF